MPSANPRQQLLEAIDQLSDRQLQAVLKFIQSLEAQPNLALPDPPLDPLANFVGSTTQGSLAQGIDETLYG